MLILFGDLSNVAKKAHSLKYYNITIPIVLYIGSQLPFEGTIVDQIEMFVVEEELFVAQEVVTESPAKLKDTKAVLPTTSVPFSLNRKSNDSNYDRLTYLTEGVRLNVLSTEEIDKYRAAAEAMKKIDDRAARWAKGSPWDRSDYSPMHGREKFWANRRMNEAIEGAKIKVFAAHRDEIVSSAVAAGTDTSELKALKAPALRDQSEVGRLAITLHDATRDAIDTKKSKEQKSPVLPKPPQ